MTRDHDACCREASNATDSTFFASHRELTRLPYFDLDATGDLVADRALGPVVDVHTHLALSYFTPFPVNLERDHPRVEHYLPFDAALELDVYINRNFTDAHLARLKRDLTVRSATRDGMRVTHTMPNLRREMRKLGVRASALLPIDLPVPFSNNAKTYLKLVRRRGHGEFIGFGSIHPYAPGNLAVRLDRQVALGARGIKVHPAAQMVYPDAPRGMELYSLCGARGLPVLWHCGPVDIEPPPGRRRSQVRHYERPIAETPQTTFILGHSGALQWEQGLALAQRYPNVWLEISSQSLTGVRRIVEEGPADRILFGSDWPFYHQGTALAKALIATEGAPEARAALLFDNAARLFGLQR